MRPAGEAFDKRQPYETDIRVPLLIRGPGIAPGQTISGMVGAIDIVPTILSILAPNAAKPEPIDGDSWLPLVNGSASSWVSRQDLLIEYNGPTIVPPLGPVTSDPQAAMPAAMQAQRRSAREARQVILGGPQALKGGTWDAEGDFSPASASGNDDGPMPAIPGVIMCGGERGTTPCDAVNNTYACVRSINVTRPGLEQHSLYCQFNDDEDFVEFYTDVDTNPWETVNVVNSSDPRTVKAMADRLRNYMLCSGDSCRDPHGLWPPPTPAGTSVLSDSRSCLTAVGSGQVGAVAKPCFAPFASWNVSVDAKGFPQLESAAQPGQCVNLIDAVCAAGQGVHLYDCQGDDTRVHTADHWTFDSAKGQIQAAECAGMCLASPSSAGGDNDWEPVTLQRCGTPGTSGWTASA